MGDSETSASRPTLVDRSLDAEERARLLVLRAATEPSAPIYAAIMSVLVQAKERYQVQVRTEEIASALATGGFDTASLTGSLEQLKEWGAVAWTQDTGRVYRLEDFNRRRELWQLTAVGHAAHDSVLRVLGAAEHSGSLQRALFRDILENLAALSGAVEVGDATATYLRLRDLDGALIDLAANARDFHATIGQLRLDTELEPERFLAYKNLLIEYLQNFLDDLFRYRTQIERSAALVEARGIDRMVALAAEGDDSTGLFAAPDLAGRWQQRWDGLVAWFRRSPQHGTAGADDLASATTSAIRDLMAFLRKLTESATRPITRASELVHLARWFARLEAADAHRLFDAAFGLGQPLHLGQEEEDPDRTSASQSWWEAAPVPVSFSLREYGKRAGAPPPSLASNFSSVRAMLLEEHEARRAERLEAAAALSAKAIEERTLTPAELDLLLDLLDRALHERPLRGDFKVEIEAEGLRVVVSSGDSDCVIAAETGSLTLPHLEVEVLRS
jgi:uncharacterized protein (TIGR02677 family)